MDTKGAEDFDVKELEEAGVFVICSQEVLFTWAWPTFQGVPQREFWTIINVAVLFISFGGLWTLPVFSANILRPKTCSRAPQTLRLFLVRGFVSCVSRSSSVGIFDLKCSRR